MRFKLSRWNAVSIIIYHAAPTLEIDRDKHRTGICIQGILDQFHNHPIQVNDRRRGLDLRHYLWRKRLDTIC